MLDEGSEGNEVSPRSWRPYNLPSLALNGRDLMRRAAERGWRSEGIFNRREANASEAKEYKIMNIEELILL